jgi:hypothetical protein
MSFVGFKSVKTTAEYSFDCTHQSVHYSKYFSLSRLVLDCWSFPEKVNPKYYLLYINKSPA